MNAVVEIEAEHCTPGSDGAFQVARRTGMPVEIPEWADAPVEVVPIRLLVVAGSPRLAGADPEHIRTLADVMEDLPPIIVHRPTLQVIDGVHRVEAARLNGRTSIRARLVDCESRAVFVLAVHANVAHGLPLSLEDRKAAAANVVASYPHWSDRAVAMVTGLSDKTIGGIREGDDSAQVHARLGRDGRLRPLNTAERRLQAAALIQERPEAGLREIARATGLSPATVRDVRRRTESGLDPVPDRYRAPEDREQVKEVVRPLRRPENDSCLVLPADRESMLAKLMSDPSVRFSQAGKYTMRWLYHYTVDSESCRNLADTVPDHWARTVAQLARGCAMAWDTLADQLEARSWEAAG